MPKMQTDDGVDIHYHVHDFRDPWITDQGETILLSHGFCRSMKWWNQWVPALSRKYRVVRYDVRGCGFSSQPPEGTPWSADRLAKDALNLIDHLAIDQVHWVGFESGGMWGKVFAINHPDRIKSLAVLNTPSAVAKRNIMNLSKEQVKGSEVLAKVGLKQWLLDTLTVRMDMKMADPKMMEWHIAEQSKTPTQVAVGISQSLENLSLEGKYEKIQVPTLIMIGDRARNCPVDEQMVVQKQIPNAGLVVFPNIAAGSHLLMPDRCTDEVLRFLERV